jgi:imidazolonepropionase-like amidohydrolase
MVEAGMRSREAIKAATVNAAKLLDLSDEVGTIASGKSGDVIAVDSSPLDDVSVLERVTFVWPAATSIGRDLVPASERMAECGHGNVIAQPASGSS